jgi:hypothetical protein
MEEEYSTKKKIRDVVGIVLLAGFMIWFLKCAILY